MTDDNWNPGYFNKFSQWMEYEKRWFCNKNKIIHQHLKEKENCKYCTKK